MSDGAPVMGAFSLRASISACGRASDECMKENALFFFASGAGPGG